MVRALANESRSMLMEFNLSRVKHLDPAVKTKADKQCLALLVFPDPDRPMKATL